MGRQWRAILTVCALTHALSVAALAQPVESLNPVEDASGAVVDIDTQKVCVTGTNPGKPCAVDGDCPGSGTCSTARIGLQGSWTGRPKRLPTTLHSFRTISTGPDAIALFAASETPCQRCCVTSHLANADRTVCTGGSNDGTACTSDGTCTGGGTCELAALYVGYADTVDDTDGLELLPGDDRCVWAPASLDCADVYVYGQDEHTFNGRCE